MIDYSPSSELAIKADPYIPEYFLTTEEEIIEEGSTTPFINKDANLILVEGATVDNNTRISTRIGDNPHYSSQSPSIATVSINGYVSRVSDGTARILAESKGDKQILRIPVSREVGIQKTTFGSWRAGTLAKYADDRTQSLTSGVTPSPMTIGIFNGSIRNTSNIFYNGYNKALTAISYLTNGTSWMGFTAITSRHVVSVSHIGDYTGLPIVFIDENNNQVSRTLIKRYGVSGRDVAIYLLDSALPSSISPMSLAPTNLSGYIPNTPYKVPVVFSDRDHLLNLGGTIFMEENSIGVTSLSGSRGGFYTEPVEGTSGKPIMLVARDPSIFMILLGIFSYPTAGPLVYNLPWSTIIPALDSSAGISTELLPSTVPLNNYTFYA